MYHRPPLTDLYAVAGLDRIAVLYDGYIGGGAAHIYNQCALFVCKMLSADHTGGRPAQQRFHRMLRGEPAGHHCAVAANDPDGNRNAKLLQRELDRVKEALHDRLKPSIQERTGAPPQNIPLVEQIVSQDAGNAKNVLDLFGAFPFQHAAVVHGVDLHDRHAGAIRKFVRQLFSESFLIHRKRTPRLSWQHAESVNVGKAIRGAVLGNDLRVRPDQDKARPPAFVLHAGIGRHSGRKRHIVSTLSQLLRDLAQCVTYSNLQVVPRCLRLRRKQNFISLAVIYDNVCTGAARINSNTDHCAVSSAPLPASDR